MHACCCQEQQIYVQLVQCGNDYDHHVATMMLYGYADMIGIVRAHLPFLCQRYLWEFACWLAWYVVGSNRVRLQWVEIWHDVQIHDCGRGHGSEIASDSVHLCLSVLHGHDRGHGI